MATNPESEEPVTKRISRERKNLISHYATAAVCLYGVINVGEFVDVFNHYENAYTTSKEALLALERHAKMDDVEYSIAGGIISGPEFQPDFDDYKENVVSIRAEQKGKPRFLPSKEEFLKYVEFCYLEPKEPYADLKAYILKHKLTVHGEGIDGIDGDLIDLHEMIQFGVSTTSVYDCFTERGYQYKNMRVLDDFAQLIMNVHNNTRMYDNNGFTPYELVNKYEKSKSEALTAEQNIHQTIPKAGLNDPYPCGSGLKYKNCCGK